MTFKKKAGLGLLAAAVVATGVYAKNFTMINLMGWSWLPYAAKALVAGLSLPSLTTVGIVAAGLAVVGAAVYGLRRWNAVRTAFDADAPVAPSASVAATSSAQRKSWIPTIFSAIGFGAKSSAPDVSSDAKKGHSL